MYTLVINYHNIYPWFCGSTHFLAPDLKLTLISPKKTVILLAKEFGNKTFLFSEHDNNYLKSKVSFFFFF
jgi:hypothetical protein